MNKRKAKKQRGKCFYPLVDGLNLLTYSEEEREEFNKELNRYAVKHFSYKHYKDKDAALKKIMQHPTIYPPASRKQEEFNKTIKGRNIQPIIVMQSLDQLKDVEPINPQKNALIVAKQGDK